MKAKANREGLLTAFQVVASVVPARSPKPILKHTKLELGEDNSATLLATDLELGIRYRVSGVEVEESGVAVLPASELMSILRELPDETVSLDASDTSVTIAGASSRFELSALDPLTYPDIPEFGESAGNKIKAGTLATMIRRTVFAVAAENSRYALHSVLIEFNDGHANLVATDGKRLARMPGKVAVAGETPNGQWLIPPKALTLIQKTLVDPDEDVEIELRPNEILFRTSKVMIYSRLVEGRFPNYRDVFPPNANIRIPVAVGKLHGVIRQAKIVTNDESKGVDFHFREGLLTLESRGADLGSSEITLPIGYEGDDIDITFDPQLLIDALRVLDSDEEISVDIVDTRRATVLRSGDEYEYVVMPLTRER